LNTSRPTVARWKARFEQDRIPGLRAVTKAVGRVKSYQPCKARLLKKTQQKPGDGSTHWSCRKMAAAVGLSPATVQRIWSKTKLKPRRLDRYMASNDPEFEQKAADFIRFHTDVIDRTPAQQEIHIVLDNLSAHKTGAVAQFLEKNPRVHFRFTPTYSSWFNQVELWFAKIQRVVITRGVFTSVADLSRKLMKYIRSCAKAAKPFRWSYTNPNRRIVAK